MSTKTIPVTVLAGFLGAGKTTLLNNILRDPQGHKIAVIVNDIGEINIDAELITKGGFVDQNTKATENEVMALSNGCICCTLQPDLIKQLTTLLERGNCDYILIEASGICEPQPIAETIESVSQGLADAHAPVQCVLDSVITVTDAFRLADEFECGEHFTDHDDHDHDDDDDDDEDEEEEDLDSLLIQQIEFCNIVLLNKTDLITDEQKKQITAVVKALNPAAEIIESDHCKVDISSIIDTGKFDLGEAYRAAGWARAMEEEEQAERDEHHGKHHDDDDDDDHDGHHGHHHHHDHEHTGEGEALEYGINTCVFSEVRPFSRAKFEEVMPELGKSIIRSKGFVWFREQPEIVYIFEQCGKQLSLQAASKWVAAMPERDRKQVLRDYPDIAASWDDKYGDRLNRVVFIGQGIHEDEIYSALKEALTV